MRPEMVAMYIYLRRNLAYFIHGHAEKRKTAWATSAEMRARAEKLLRELNAAAVRQQ